jgi:hypothetical protein
MMNVFAGGSADHPYPARVEHIDPEGGRLRRPPHWPHGPSTAKVLFSIFEITMKEQAMIRQRISPVFQIMFAFAFDVVVGNVAIQ